MVMLCMNLLSGKSSVDTFTIIAVIANEPEKEALIELTKGADLIALHSVHWENGQTFVIRPESKVGSPLDVKGIDLHYYR